jgi:hypothetical protein
METTSKLTRMSDSLSEIVLSMWLQSSEFLMWEGECPKNELVKFVRYFANEYVKETIQLTMCLRGTPTLWIFGSTGQAQIENHPFHRARDEAYISDHG